MLTEVVIRFGPAAKRISPGKPPDTLGSLSNPGNVGLITAGDYCRSDTYLSNSFLLDSHQATVPGSACGIICQTTAFLAHIAALF
jgi:hypothetical protein